MKSKWTHILWIFLICSTMLSARPMDFPEAVWDSEDLFGYWGGRKVLAKYGIYYLSTAVVDLDWPTTGGIKTTDYPLFLFLYNLECGINLEQLLGFNAGSIYTSFLVHGGQDPTLKFIGDFQGVDNIEAYNLVQLAELWYQHRIIDEKYSITLGKIDAYSIFPYTHYAQILLNNSYSQFPTIVAFPSYPNSAVGIVFMGNIRDWITLKASIFDGSNAQGIRTGNLGAKLFFQNLGKHILFLNQIDFSWRPKQEFYKGRATVGLWGFNGRLQTFTNKKMGKALGLYFGASQSLWKEREKKIESSKPFKAADLGAFIQWGYANPQISGTAYYVGGGLTYYNLIKKFDSDTISIGVATAFFSKAEGSPFIKTAETALEITYQFNILPHFSIQPDLQWVINPGGNGNRNALVAILRLTVSI